MGLKLGRKFRNIGRKASKVVRAVAKSDLVQQATAHAVSSLVPGGSAIVSGYQRVRKARAGARRATSLVRSVTGRPAARATVSGAVRGAVGAKTRGEPLWLGATAGAAGGFTHYQLTKPRGGQQVAGLPSMPSLVGKRGGPGILPRGPGGKLQWPWQDPNIPKMLEQFACDDAYLTPSYRAPKGFVVWRNAAGRPFGLWKPVARIMGWKPKKKPPISVRDWSALTRADRTVNKLKGIVRRAKNLKSVKSL